MEVLAQLVKKRSVEAERRHRSDTIGFILSQLLQNEITIVVFRSRLGARKNADMRMRRDKTGNDRLAAIVDHSRTGRHRNRACRANREDAAVANDHCCIVDRVSGCAVNHPRGAQDDRLIRGWGLRPRHRRHCEQQHSGKQGGKVSTGFHGRSPLVRRTDVSTQMRAALRGMVPPVYVMTLERPIWPNSNGQTLYFPMCAIFIFAPRAHGLINIVLTAAMHRALRALFDLQTH